MRHKFDASLLMLTTGVSRPGSRAHQKFAAISHVWLCYSPRGAVAKWRAVVANGGSASAFTETPDRRHTEGSSRKDSDSSSCLVTSS